MILLKDVAFVLIPKNASTSLRAYFLPDQGKLLTLAGDPPIEHVSIEEAIYKFGISDSMRYIGIFRDPFERQLSLYLYRHRQNRYNTIPSIHDFRARIASGVIQDHPWQMRTQTSFMKVKGKVKGEIWPYEKLNELFKEFGTLPHLNNSISYRDPRMLDAFYDQSTRKAVQKYWEEDIYYHKKALNDYTKSSNRDKWWL